MITEATYKACVKIIKDLEAEVKRLKSEYNVLKKNHLKFLEESSENRIRDAQRVLRLKKDYNKLLEEERNRLMEHEYGT